ncbi:MAG: hypothetical protein H7281_10870 [Bacteriovorax sp.]|nr:hypothetical protein [Bacteriovorax sp.]
MMKNKLLLFLLLSSVSKVFGQDCTGMVDNEEQRLDKNGGPLTQSRIQDQDGLGTCFANSTSVALQTALPGNPDVSYLQLAFSHAQKEYAPKNTAQRKDSAYIINLDGSRGNVLINGGQVCDTIKAVKDKKIGGVCKRDDVALEKSIFDSKTNNSKDSLFVQNTVIAAASEYYDSTKLDFGVNPSFAKDEIAKRTLAFTNYKMAFDGMIEKKQAKFTKEACLKPDTSNVQIVLKNLLARNYAYLTNKYGSSNSSKIYENVKGKANPDSAQFFYLMNVGSSSKYSDGEVRVTVEKKLNDSLEKNYIGELNSTNPPSDALSALRNILMSVGGSDKAKSNKAVVDKLISEFSPEDKEILNKDYNRYVKKEVGECMNKNALSYYTSDDGLIKDFAQDPCLKGYLVQGKNIKNLAGALDQGNFLNINTLNSFMNKLPTMSYEETMRAIVAPECSDDKKIKVPESLTCESNNFNYPYMLQQKLVDTGKFTHAGIEQQINLEAANDLVQIESSQPQKIAQVEEKYSGKTDANSLKLKALEIQNLEIDKVNRKNNAHEVAKAKINKQLAGSDEPRIWNEYVEGNKKKFNSDAVNLLKNAKQAVPITLCTRMFNDPSSTALRDGRCEKNSSDSSYKDVGGYHAVTVVGVRCQKGKLNYLIQNSWGEWSAIKEAKNPDGTQHFESEFGKAWMGEDEIMNNSYGYQKITK